MQHYSKVESDLKRSPQTHDRTLTLLEVERKTREYTTLCKYVDIDYDSMQSKYIPFQEFKNSPASITPEGATASEPRHDRSKYMCSARVNASALA